MRTFVMGDPHKSAIVCRALLDYFCAAGFGRCPLR